MNTTLARDSKQNSQSLGWSCWRPHCRRTFERELPIFLTLLTVTAETGLHLHQSLKCLSQSSDTECPHLIKIFTAILERANATEVLLYDALVSASQEIKVGSVANVTTALAVPTETTDELLAILKAQTLIANSLRENKCIKLRKNYWRRWTPHVLFFIMFALPLIILPIIGPAFLQSTLLAFGPSIGSARAYSEPTLIDTH